tara:strand:- start:389 stop:802 length:414 start_codon:yes stop_codon:yes gene_type:complete
MFEKYIKDKRTKEEDEEINEQKKKVDDLKKEIDKFTGSEEEKEKKKEQLKDENRILDNLESNFKTSQLTEFLKNVDNEKNSSITKDFIDHYHHLSSLPSSMPVTHNHDNLPIHTHKNLQSVTPTLSVPGTILRFIRR